MHLILLIKATGRTPKKTPPLPSNTHTYSLTNIRFIIIIIIIWENSYFQLQKLTNNEAEERTILDSIEFVFRILLWG
jgi:hypothetical protein